MGFLQCNGGKLEEAEDFKSVFIVYFAKQSDVLRDFFSAIAESWKKLKTSNLFSSFIMSSNRNRSALL